MERTITISEEIYAALQREADQHQQDADTLAEGWLRQHLNLDKYPDLEWRQGAAGWRVGIKGTAIDVYTAVGYSQAGYSAQEIAGDLLPQLSLEQVHSALRYYADYPDEIDRILAESEPEAIKARLYRSLGPTGYRRLTAETEEPTRIREARARYRPDEQD
jgi:uncharacterized protein (DUF433 family)